MWGRLRAAPTTMQTSSCKTSWRNSKSATRRWWLPVSVKPTPSLRLVGSSFCASLGTVSHTVPKSQYGSQTRWAILRKARSSWSWQLQRCPRPFSTSCHRSKQGCGMAALLSETPTTSFRPLLSPPIERACTAASPPYLGKGHPFPSRSIRTRFLTKSTPLASLGGQEGQTFIFLRWTTLTITVQGGRARMTFRRRRTRALERWWRALKSSRGCTARLGSAIASRAWSSSLESKL
mmetsp:Transcript_7905/g.20123  ORF Transcript_7905/g.20123 Transcript_7905/m.20123 type:complete len:235 (+) Transcript_7905:110-814(+)